MVAKRVSRRMTMVLRVAWTVVLLCGAGCNSYRVCGHADVSGTPMRNLNRTYRLQQITVRNVSSMPVQLWTTEYALAKTPISAYERLVTRSRPDVFAERPDSIPIVVEVSLRNSEGSLGWTILVPYLVTLGILPAQLQYDDVCGVIVRRLDTGYSMPEETFMFQQKTQLTALSPFGLGGFGHDSTATAERSGSGVMATPDTNINVRNNIAEALAETMAATIVESLRRMEAAESSSTLVQPVAPSNVVPVQATPAAAQSPLPAQSSLDEKLKVLKKLRDSGIITQEESDRLILRAVEMN